VRKLAGLFAWPWLLSLHLQALRLCFYTCHNLVYSAESIAAAGEAAGAAVNTGADAETAAAAGAAAASATQTAASAEGSTGKR
jgi:hypothetical protein